MTKRAHKFLYRLQRNEADLALVKHDHSKLVEQLTDIREVQAGLACLIKSLSDQINGKEEDNETDSE